MASVQAQLSKQFYQWEARGRGWQVFEEPIFPEPPPAAPAMDSGSRLSFLESLFCKPPPPVLAEAEEEPDARLLVREPLVELQTSLPAKLDISREAFDQFLANLSLCREPIAFELLGSHQRVVAQFAASETDVSQVRRQLQAHFPEATFLPRTGTLYEVWEACEGDQVFALEFGLERAFMFPLASGKIDPFIGIIGALAELQPGELGLFQVLFQPVQHPWADSIVRSVTHADGKPFFVNNPELTTAAARKVQRPLFAAVVRIMARTAARDRLVEIARDLAGSLRVFAQPQGNALIPLENDDYPHQEHIEDVLLRQTRRTGMLLNSDELFGFVHLPASAVRSPVLLRDAGKTKAAPDIVQKPPGVVIGDNEHAGETVPVFLTADQRVRHTHIIGSSGTGKSSLLLNLIRQDILNGDGVAVLDPHGDLIDQILSIIPEDRIDDVVLVNPSDVEFPIGFNILQAHSEEEKNLIASDLVSVFRRLATSWGDQMDIVLQNAILVFLESNRGGTLADLRRFLIEPPFRNEFLKTVTDPELIYYWQKVFPQLSGGKSIGPVLTRLQDFFSRKPLRNMVSQPTNKLDFAGIMDTGKIFLAKLSEGLCGAENSYLLGTLLVSKFQQLAMARQSQEVARRKQFWLYIDEFDHFITPSMAEILKGARKYRLGLTLAHQELHQLQSDSKVASAVMAHPCTRIVFRVSDDDAKKLGEGFTAFDAQSLKTLEKFHAIARVERNDFDFNLALRKPELPEFDDGCKARIITASRARYATPRAEVEAMLLATIRPDAGKTKPPTPPDTNEPPGGGQKPAPKPVSSSDVPAEPTPPISPTAMVMPAVPPPVLPKISEPPPIAAPPKAAEIPKATTPPTTE
ncbi:MAG: type IV secretion system DNA-binding domain-containing protein, partial [Verrucomicrobia bacterium]|nr:type IV secretion system DNA-binding domain-containing protein [Verrucomicrobiota bacterium]